MRPFLAILAVVFAPVAAWAQEQDADCAKIADSALALATAVRLTAVSAPAVREDGACKIATAQIDDVALTDIVFSWTTVAGVQNVEVAIAAMQIATLGFAVTASFKYQPDSGALTLDRFSARADGGAGVLASGRIMVGDPAKATVESISAQMFVTADLMNTLDLGAQAVSRPQITNAMDGLDFGQLDRQSRQDVLRFAEVIPNARGRLDLTLQASKGVVVGQMILPFIGASEAEIPEALSAALQGVYGTLRWNPGRM